MTGAIQGQGAVGIGGGGGGGGLTLGPPTNEFTAANKAAAETARDAYATANASWLAQYDDEATFTIIVAWPTTPTNTVYQARRSSSWADVTGLVRGPRGLAGTDGDDGEQGRFLVYAYVNSAVAPTATPTGGTFVQSTGTLTVPVGYTAIPVTPVLTERTYRTQAVVNPRTDPDSVTLVWVLPSEAPEYDAAGLAEGFADDAAASAAEAAQSAGQAVDIPTGSPRGALVATSPTLPTAATGSNTVISFGATEVWDVSADAPDGYEAGPAASNERLYLPDIHPAGSNGMFVVVEVGGIEIAEVFISQGGIQGATGADRRHILPVSLTADALIRIGFWPRSSTTASYIQLTGNSDTLSASTVVKVYLAVVRGDGGGGGGGGVGPTGPAGADGSQVLFGAADPAATDGSDGDVWIQTTDGEIYKKAGGAWTLQYTFPSGTPDPGDHTRRAAISTDTTLESTENDTATTSTTQEIVIPTWTTGTRYVFLGVPEDEDDITDIEKNGVSDFGSWEAVAAVAFAHKWWRTTLAQNVLNSGSTYTIIQ